MVGSRSVFVAILLAALATLGGCAFSDPGIGDCDLRPVDTREARHLEVPVAASCATQVEVDGRVYGVGVGRWLDEGLLVMEQYGPITRTNAPIDEPVAFALEGSTPSSCCSCGGAASTTSAPWVPGWCCGAVSVPRPNRSAGTRTLRTRSFRSSARILDRYA
jgi:hypothetical protein